MRLEGTHTFPAAIERVYGALCDADTLATVVPGCERLIQLGPPETDGAVTFEARLRDGTLTLRVVPARRPDHLRIAAHGHVASGKVAGRGTVDLVAQEAHTLGAYALEIDAPNWQIETAQSAARALCERLATALWRAAPETLPAGELLPSLDAVHEVTTPRGRIVALPRLALLEQPADIALSVWARRTFWMGAGLVLGVGAVALALAIVHRLADHDE